MTRYNDDDDDDDPSPQGRIPSERWISSTTTSVEGGFIRTSSGRLVPTRGSSKSILDDPTGSDTLSTGPLEGEQLMDSSNHRKGSRLWNRLCQGNCMTNIAFVLAITCFIAGATAILWVFTSNQSDGFVNQHSFRRHKDVEKEKTPPLSPPKIFTLPAPPYDLQEKCSPDNFLQTAEGLAICEMICGPATSCCIVTSSSDTKLPEAPSSSSSSNYYKYDDDNNNDDAGDDKIYYYNNDDQQPQEEEEEPMIPSYYKDDNVNNNIDSDDDDDNYKNDIVEELDDDDDDYVQDDFYNNGRTLQKEAESSCYEANEETCQLYYEGCQHIYINGEIFGPP